MNQRPERLTDLIARLLDKGYISATQQVIRSIVRDSTTGVIAQRLNELDDEAQRLAGIGRRLKPDNPVVVALLADFEQVLRADAQRINDAASDLQLSAIQASNRITRQLAFPNLSDDALREVLGFTWNTPSVEAIASAVDFTDLPAWQNKLQTFAPNLQGVIRNQAIRGIAEGWSPLKTAAEIRRTAEALPAHAANNTMRTLQMQSYRTANTANYIANDAILDGHIRIAALDVRTCMACIALHGTTLKTGERVDDHHQGRCTSIPLVKGRPRSIQSGRQWFAGLSNEEQTLIAGKAKLEALQRGDFRWEDIPKDYTDEAFGNMVREATLRELLNK